MSESILTCAICGKFVDLPLAKTDGGGKAVHEECYVETLPATRSLAISPITLAGPRCHAEPGVVCEILLDDGIEVVHVERIRWAAAMDARVRSGADD